jgi:hypothetical protein
VWNLGNFVRRRARAVEIGVGLTALGKPASVALKDYDPNKLSPAVMMLEDQNIPQCKID